MKKVVLVIATLIILASITTIGGIKFWSNYLSYYWYTDVIQGDLVGEQFILCGIEKNYQLEIQVTTANSKLIDFPRDDFGDDKSYYFEGRGFIYESEEGNSVHIVELLKLLPIEKSECTLTR